MAVTKCWNTGRGIRELGYRAERERDTYVKDLRAMPILSRQTHFCFFFKLAFDFFVERIRIWNTMLSHVQ